MNKKRGTILVVDDSLVNLRIIQGVLEQEYTVYLAVTALQSHRN